MLYIKFFLAGLLQINNNVIDNKIYNENILKNGFPYIYKHNSEYER
jgi:hypothetical protein